MNTINDEIIKKVYQWATYAEEDLCLASHALTLSSGCPYRLIAYHAQQCAEKYLKSFLVLRNIDFPYTHNISRLLELCSEHTNWLDELEEAEELTPFAITTRYPGEDEEVTKDEAIRAIEISLKVKEFVSRALKQEGIDILDEK